MPPADVETASGSLPQGSCYRIQVLVVGCHKRWRDEVSAQVRMLGYQVTACDRGVDAMTVLALGLPVDVLVTDVSLQGKLCCLKLAQEARALRPDLRIVFASDLGLQPDEDASDPIDTLFEGDLPQHARAGLLAVRRIDHVASTVWDALRSAS